MEEKQITRPTLYGERMEVVSIHMTKEQKEFTARQPEGRNAYVRQLIQAEMTKQEATK
jgi:hypothetical protein